MGLFSEQMKVTHSTYTIAHAIILVFLVFEDYFF